MRNILFKAWYIPEKKMYYRGYQKITHVLLCEDDQDKGSPVKRAAHEECELLECSDVLDRHKQLIFEGDIVRIFWEKKQYIGLMKNVPDMFRSQGLHPLESLLAPFELTGDEEGLSFEIIGNQFENPELLEKLSQT